MKQILTIITLFLFSFGNAQNNTLGITIEEEIKEVNCRQSPTSASVYLNITTKYEYAKFKSKIRIEKLDGNGEYQGLSSKLLKDDGSYKYYCGGLAFGSYTYRFYQYPDTKEYRDFDKVPKNSWVEKTFQVTKKCK